MKNNAKKIAKCILGAVSVLFLLWFLLPVFTHGILNIGNVTGIVLFLLVLLCVMFSGKLGKGLARFWEKRLGKLLIGAGVAVLAAAALLVCVETAFMVQAAGRSPGEEATVVVLGCRVYGETPSLMLVERLEAAYGYLEENPASCCVLSGGQGPGENISEAEAMYRWLKDRGIDESRLFLEDASTSTRENIDFALKVIEEKGLSPNLAIATNEFHEYRAQKVAKALGADYAALPGKTAWWLLPTYYMRELYGILYEWLL